MKRIYLIILVILITNLGLAQSNIGFNYKALITENGNPLVNHPVNIRFTLTYTGMVVYKETHSTTTDANGIINVNIGEGTPVTGDFSNIYWGYYHILKVEIDTGNGYHVFSDNQLRYVYKAKYADRAGHVDIVDKIRGIPVSSTLPTNGQVLKYNGTQFVPADDDTSGGSGTDGVVNSASFSGSATKTLTLARSNGLSNITATFTDAVNDADHSTTNEIQHISKNGSTVTLSNNGGSFTDAVNDADHDTTNEIQHLSISSNQISLSNGGGTVSLPDQHDADFYKVGAAAPATSINDDIYTRGSVKIYGPDIGIAPNLRTHGDIHLGFNVASGSGLYFGINSYSWNSGDYIRQTAVGKLDLLAGGTNGTQMIVDNSFNGAKIVNKGDAWLRIAADNDNLGGDDGTQNAYLQFTTDGGNNSYDGLIWLENLSGDTKLHFDVENQETMVMHDGNVQIPGKITAPATGSNDLKAFAYGTIHSDGVIASGTGNFQVDHSLGAGIYKITFTGENYDYSHFTTVVSLINVYHPAFVYSYAMNNTLVVKTYERGGTTLTNYAFSFVTYKN